MKVYEIGVDVEKYRWIMPVQDPVPEWRWFFRCEPKPQWTSPLLCHVYDLRKEAGNFYEFATDALTFDETALEGMRDIFEMAGEILPIELEEEYVEGAYRPGGRLYVLNVLECVNALDKEKSEWRRGPAGEKISLKNYAFHRNRMPESSLFKVPEDNYSSVLTYVGLKDPEDEFIGRYQALGLTGLIFEELWSDE